MRKQILCWWLILACLLGLASCEREDFPVKIGGTTIAALPIRVVSLSPLTTEMLDAIGAAAHLVGRSQECDYPPAVAEQPSMGTALNPNVDAIIESEATLVLTATPLEDEMVQRLENHGIAVLCFSAVDTLEEIEEAYVALATAMGGANQGPDNGKRAYEMLRERLQAVADAVSGQASVKACYLGGLYTCAPKESLPGELLGMMGVQNTATGEEWQEESQAGAQAQVIFCDNALVDAVLSDPAYAQAEAVRNGKVIGLDSVLWERQGLRLAEVAAQMAAALYPDCEIPSFAESVASMVKE